MQPRQALQLLSELAEKMGLLAAAALLAVLLPPLRNRLLGVGQRRDKFAAVLLGLGLSVWGALLGFEVGGEPINVRAIGVLIAAILGGPKAGALAGLGGGLFYAALVDPLRAPWVLAASIIDGVLAGFVSKRWPEFFAGGRVFFTALGIQGIHLILVGAGLLVVGQASEYVPAWPAHLIKLLVNASGVTLFVTVARLVVSREDNRVALVEARAEADSASLEALRRKLEPHFLFNSLNVLRAMIRRDPSKARDLVDDLADLYRYLLSHPEEATLGAEVQHASAYLAVERARLGEERFRVELDVDPELKSLPVPALLLQPLAENAVRHGIAPREGPGLIRIEAERVGDTLIIRVRDQAQGIAQAVEPGHGIALTTLRSRLLRRYGEEAALTLEPDAESMLATVCLPLHPSATLGAGSKAEHTLNLEDR